jgi:periplasmic protein CpxP/Spy
MKRVHKFGVLAAAAALALGVSVPLTLGQSGESSATNTPQNTATPRGKHRFGGHRRGFGRHMAFGKLNLTGAQKAQLKQIRESHQSNLMSLHQQLREKRQELRQLTQGGSFDEAVASQKLAEMAPLQAKVMAEQNQMRQEFLAVLTPDQKAQLDQMRSKWQGQRGGPRQSQQ